MAYSYNDYVAGTNSDGTSYTVTTDTVFASPPYLSGRGDSDVTVTVDGVIKVKDTDYTITNTEVKFLFAKIPPAGAKIRISRNSSQGQRITDYSDASLLNADTMDADANQLFFMAQEAIDTASETNLAVSTFYSSGTSTPSSASSGDLFFNTATGLLQIYTGSAWESVNNRGTKQTFAISGSTTVFTPSTPVDDNTLVFLNGVLLVKGAGSAGDYTTSSTQVTLNTAVTSGVVEIVTFPNATNGTFTSGINVTGTVTADGLTLGDSEYIKIGEGNNAGIPDLQIFSGGGNGFIEQPSGSGNNNLIIRGQNINLRNDADATLISTDNDQVRMWTQVAGAEDSTNGAAKFSTTTTGVDVNGTITTKGLTLDTGVGSSEATLQSSTGAAKLHINTTASGGTRFASIELGGTDGAFIDLKEPNSDDYDFRIEHGIGSDNVSAVSSKHPLVLQTLATSAGGTGGDVKIKREGVEKLATSANGIDVTGDIEVTDNTKGVILKSPNGSRFRLEVANDGTLSTEAL